MRKINVVTTCMPEVPDTVPEKNMERAVILLDSFQGLKPDLICLPENFMEISVPQPKDYSRLAEVCHSVLSEKAKMLDSYIVAGVHEIIDSKLYNVAWLFSRKGELAGRYIKHYPTDYEMERGVIPGNDVPVFETDFGKIGILICFDIDWPEIWTEMGSKGAELMVWISAYEGGYPLKAYAMANAYYVVSSVRGTCSRIIDKSGSVLTSSSRWVNWSSRIIDLDKTMFHIDHQFDKLLSIQKTLGNRVTVESFDEEGRFMLESNDPEWPVGRIIKEFQLETFKVYHNRTRAMQKTLAGL